jgi:lysophospholipid acyltransferase (LPLAT)-like uncharacterized protein
VLWGRLLGWLGALYLALVARTSRVRCHEDPRPRLRAEGARYVFPVLHAHCMATVVGHGEACLGTMVSRSADGELIARAAAWRRIVAVRGSVRKGNVDKGGQEALLALIAWMRENTHPACLVADGSRGPRGHVYAGIVKLAQSVGAIIVPVAAIARFRIRLGTWDRLQVPLPFGRIDLYFGEPAHSDSDSDSDSIRAHLARELARLEATYDPTG